MGKAKDWQQYVQDEVARLTSKEVIFLNPRRDNWDPTWEQSKNNPQFRQQVTWELDNIRTANLAFFYFQGGTLSPISLLELGLCLEGEVELIVCCEDEFWRKGNVDITSELYRVEVYSDLDVAIKLLVQNIEKEA
jgi:hypothetical protein